ncbi:unnamed protein product [Taenia asiatica]|uniref:G5 domain-containing protein n=1 Tax=Taenia asiatica TaxID=60517 RepID=A0A0R3VTI9_TAEAS|nr:unnamed protein product [Taenia asiatica]
MALNAAVGNSGEPSSFAAAVAAAIAGAKGAVDKEGFDADKAKETTPQQARKVLQYDQVGKEKEVNGLEHSYQVTYREVVTEERKEDFELAKVTETEKVYPLTPVVVSLGPPGQQQMSTGVTVEVTDAKREHCQRLLWLHDCCQSPIRKKEGKRIQNPWKKINSTRADME